MICSVDRYTQRARAPDLDIYVDDFTLVAAATRDMMVLHLSGATELTCRRLRKLDMTLSATKNLVMASSAKAAALLKARALSFGVNV